MSSNSLTVSCHISFVRPTWTGKDVAHVVKVGCVRIQPMNGETANVQAQGFMGP